LKNQRGEGMNHETLHMWGTSLTISLFTFLFGGWSDAMACLFYAVILDFVSGWLVAGKRGNLKSKISYVGIKRKIFIFIMVAVGSLIDRVLGTAATTDIASQLDLGMVKLVQKGHVIRDMIIYFYLANELLSIVENAGKVGLVPNFVRKMVELLNPEKRGGGTDV
jgi:toxin secretion/phage lysis holin